MHLGCRTWTHLPWVERFAPMEVYVGETDITLGDMLKAILIHHAHVVAVLCHFIVAHLGKLRVSRRAGR